MFFADRNHNDTNYMICPIVKIGNEWKFNMRDGSNFYTTNWDNSGNIITFTAK